MVDLIKMMREQKLMTLEEFTTLDNMVQKAMIFAYGRHQGQYRKVNGKPYFVHLFEVYTIVKAAGGSVELQVAALLHDTMEDTVKTKEDFKRLEQQILAIFGEHVLKLVKSNTEEKEDSWEDRKKHTIEAAKTAPLEEKMLVAADKLSNLNALYEDYAVLGEEMWKSFKRGKSEQEKYFKGVYQSAIENLKPEIVPAYFYELGEKADKFFI